MQLNIPSAFNQRSYLPLLVCDLLGNTRLTDSVITGLSITRDIPRAMYSL